VSRVENSNSLVLLILEVAILMRKKPRLSIGMPAFNGERYIRFAIDSILSQTYKDFELIISDNASTDETQRICLEYETQDSRIHYYRNKKNIGAPANYNRVFLLSSGDYFKWAAHDDVLAPSYLEKCVNVLDNDSTIVVCHSKVGRIDENGNSMGNFDNYVLRNMGSYKTHKRFSDMIGASNTGLTLMGVIRANCLAKTALHGSYIGADLNLTAELSLMGRIHEIQEHLFFRRDHPQAYSNIYNPLARNDFNAPVRDYRSQLDWFGGKRKSFLLGLPTLKFFLECFKSVNRVPLRFSEYLLCNIEIGRWLFLKKKLILLDLVNEFQLWRNRLRYGHAKKGPNL
jgi:glycosyltransferase involved in cell wall biosynthesis